MKLMAKRRQQFENDSVVRLESRLTLHPRLGMGQRFVDAPSVAEVSGNHAAIDEKEHHTRSMMERHRGPVGRGREIVFQVKSRIDKGFLVERKAMFIVAVLPVMSKPADPS